MSNNFLKILGSVSPYTTMDESCPGYLLNLDKDKILLDCGSGICKFFKFPEDFKNLTIIISHLHKDHYSDLLIIAYASYVYKNLGILKEKINVLIPKIEKNDDSYIDYKMLKTMKEHYFNFIEYNETTSLKIKNYNINFFQTYHSVTTFAVKIYSNNFKFVYGADMGFEKIDKFSAFSKNSDLLLLESSFLTTKEKTTNYHLSSEEAAIIAVKSESKKLVLTHFWPELNKRQYLLVAKKVFNNAVLAKTNSKIILNSSPK